MYGLKLAWSQAEVASQAFSPKNQINRFEYLKNINTYWVMGWL